MRYLTAKELIIMNAVIQQTQGTSAYIRDPESLDYIVKSAQQEVFGQLLYPDVRSLATFYFINVDKKHVFNDSNKRTAVLAFYRFLKVNQVSYSGDKNLHRQLDDLAIELAASDGVPEPLNLKLQKLLSKIVRPSN
jgi:death-on-curing protein